MRDQEFLNALEMVAGELWRRADALAGDDTTEVCNLVLSNAATATLIALNVLSGRKASMLMIEGDAVSVEASAATRISCGVPAGAIHSQGTL